MRLRAGIERYIEERARSGRFRGKTSRNIGYILWDFAEHVGDIDTNQLTKAHVRSWVEGQYKTVRESTVHAKFGALRAFCGWLRREGLLRSDPFHQLEPPKKPDNLPRSLQSDLVEKLFANLPDIRAELICSLMVQSGLRAAEVASLQVGRIDFSTWQAVVTGKGQKERVVPIFEETQPILRAYLAQFPARSGPLVRSYRIQTRGLSASTISTLVSGWMTDAGIKEHAYDGVSGHALRHTCATDTYDHSRDIRAVQQFLGHSSLDITQRYVRGSAAAIRKAGEGRKYKS